MPEELTGLDYQERLVIEQIQCLQRAHEAQMAPLIKRLSNIRSMRPHQWFTVTAEQWSAMQDLGLIAKRADAPLPTEPPAA
jgi:hypothetical protein